MLPRNPLLDVLRHFFGGGRVERIGGIGMKSSENPLRLVSNFDVL